MFYTENMFYDTVQDLVALVQLGREIDSPDGLPIRDAGDSAVYQALMQIRHAIALEHKKIEDVRELIGTRAQDGTFRKEKNKMMTLYITGYFDDKRKAKDNMLGSGDISALLECNECGYWHPLSAEQYKSARKEPLIVKCPKCAD